jgi:hypothetical protein
VETSEGRIPVPEGGASIGIPTVAYSLRNLSTTYTGNVVDVRRSSDNAEDSFTAAEVADGTLEAWVNTDVVKFNPSNTTASGWYVGANISFVAGDDYMQFTGAGVRTTAGNMLGTSAVRGTDGSYSITFDAKYVSGGSLLLGEDYGGADILSVSPASNGGEWASYTVSVNPWNGSSTSFTINRRIIFTTSSGSVWQLRNVEVSQVEADGLVSKWYDQSGNGNHATDETPASQPKIVDGGTLVTKLGQPSIDFTTGSTVLLNDSFSITETESAVFAIWQPAQDSATTVQSRNRTLFSNVSSEIYIGTPNADSQMSFKRFDAVKTFTLGLASLNTPNLHAFVGTTAGADYYFNGSSIYSDTATGTNSIRNHLRIGAKQNLATHDTEGYISELIIYDSDQSANRTAIEANIGETYGITGIPAYDNTVDGFVETWYDQSGNGNDARQSVAGNQPKIVAGGSLVSGGLLTGSGQHLVMSSNFSFALNNLTSIVLGQANGGQGVGALVGLVGNLSLFSNPYRFSTTQGFRYGGESATSQPRSAAVQLFTLIGGSTTAGGYANGTLYRTVSSVSTTYTDKFAIGSYSGNLITGKVAEIIIYPTDQSANRTAIETNINNHYNIY